MYEDEDEDDEDDPDDGGLPPGAGPEQVWDSPRGAGSESSRIRFAHNWH